MKSRVCFFIDDDLLMDLKYYAGKYGVTKSTMMRMCVLALLREIKRKEDTNAKEEEEERFNRP